MVLANSFRCARSDAWSEAEVDQALPQLRTLVDSALVIDNNAKLQSMNRVAEPENVQVKSDTSPQAQVAQATAKPDVLSQRANAENELLITDVPKQADTNTLFSQIQSAQPLTEMRIAQLGRATGSLEAANSVENLQRPEQRALSRSNSDAVKAETLDALKPRKS